MYEYRIDIVKVVDGDTVDVDIDLGFGVWMKKERVRLYGIDTPESRTRDLDEKAFGLKAKDFLVEQLGKGTPVLKTHKDAKGKLMSGAKHSKTSKYLVHFKDLSAAAKKVAKK